MKKRVSPVFVKFIPENLIEGYLYISMENSVAIHLCACGCRHQVVTPFSPRDWKLTYDGRAVTLSPSIGNWRFNCRSHYWITNSAVHFAEEWTIDKVSLNRKPDSVRKRRLHMPQKDTNNAQTHSRAEREGLLYLLLRLLRR